MKFKDELQRQIYYRSQIDYSYWMIKEISGHNSKPQSPLEAMVDEATGFSKAKVKERVKEVKYLVSVIIRCKKKLDYDTENDRKLLSKLKKLELTTLTEG